MLDTSKLKMKKRATQKRRVHRGLSYWSQKDREKWARREALAPEIKAIADLMSSPEKKQLS